MSNLNKFSFFGGKVMDTRRERKDEDEEDDGEEGDEE